MISFDSIPSLHMHSPKLSSSASPAQMPCDYSNNIQPNGCSPVTDSQEPPQWKQALSAPPRVSEKSGTGEAADCFKSLENKVKVENHPIELLQAIQACLLEFLTGIVDNQAGLQNQVTLFYNLFNRVQNQKKQDSKVQHLFRQKIEELQNRYNMPRNSAEPQIPNSGGPAEGIGSEGMLQCVAETSSAKNSTSKEEEALDQRLAELRATHPINTVNDITFINYTIFSPKNDRFWYKITISNGFIDMLINHLVPVDVAKQLSSDIENMDSQTTDGDFIRAILRARVAASHSDQEPSLNQMGRSLAQVHRLTQKHTQEVLAVQSDEIEIQECLALIDEATKETFQKLKNSILDTLLTEDPNNKIYQEIEKIENTDITELRRQFINLSRKAVLRENKSFQKQQNELLKWIKKPFSPHDCFDSDKKQLKCDIENYRKYSDKPHVTDTDKLSAQEILETCKIRMKQLYSEFIYNPSYRNTFNKKLDALIDEFFNKGYQGKIAHTITELIVHCGWKGNEPRTNDKLKDLLRKLHRKNEKYHADLNYAKIIIKLQNIYAEIQSDKNTKFVIATAHDSNQVTLEDKFTEQLIELRFPKRLPIRRHTI